MKDQSIKKVVIIGSGPIIIGQAAEFDYAGTQACRALKEEGVQVVLVNSNPATIMTDKMIADHVYIEPLNLTTLKRVIEIEKPDCILPTLGGQNALNLGIELEESGFLKEHNVRIIGTSARTIKRAEDRELFKEAMEKIHQPCAESRIAETLEECIDEAEEIGYPVIVRPAYTLGGTGGGIANTQEELVEIASQGLHLSRVGQVLIERSIAGWKEIEYEVMRDANGNCIAVCNMENLDPVGVHTGDSIVVAPCQTLADKETQMLRTAALDIITELGIEGGCNVQYALNPDSFEYVVIEVNPRVSRSSALASKATGYPIAKVASKIALGYSLDEIENAITKKTFACFEPTLDYCVVKIPKWPFDKFTYATRKLGTQMKATGEVMGIAPCFEAALMKSVRSLEQHIDDLILPGLANLSEEEVKTRLYEVDDRRIFVVAEALRRGISTERIHKITKIDRWFINRIEAIVDVERQCRQAPAITGELLRRAKEFGFPDKTIAKLTGKTENAIRALREGFGVKAVFKMVDTCAAEFDAETPYYYSCYGETTEAVDSGRKKVLVIGSGPIRIGQGIEFDFCSVHSVWAFHDLGYETIIVNNNPETVSTDFDISDKLYFEPLTPEDVRNIIELEHPDGAVVQFGGQTGIKLAKDIEAMGVPVLGTSPDSIDEAEDRERFDVILNKCKIPRAAGTTIYTVEEGIAAANRIGYPVLVRPSYVLGGQGMHIAMADEDLAEYIAAINQTTQEHPILIDKYIMGTEAEVDAVCDGNGVVIPGIMEHVERAGVHSGDSISVYPPQTIAPAMQQKIIRYTVDLCRELHVVGLMNIQFIVKDDEVYVIEANPRSSRTVPYISKITGIPIVALAVAAIEGKKLPELGYDYGLQPPKETIAVKMPVFSFEKIYGADINLGPEMKSTGEVLGIATKYEEALTKAFIGSGTNLPKKGRAIITVSDVDKAEALPLAKRLKALGWELFTTGGTGRYFAQHGVETTTLRKLGEEHPNILDEILSGKVDVVINTPSKGSAHHRDGFHIRRTAIEARIPCLTSLDTVAAYIRCIEMLDHHEISVIDIAKI